MLTGAAEAGAETTKVVLAEADVNPCSACDACARSRVCIQRDSMSFIVEKMREAKVWVLATPVYWWGPTAQMKAFIDRWYSVPRSVFQGRRVILVVSSGGGAAYTHLMVKTFEEIFDYLGVEKYRVLYSSGSSSKTAARTDASLLKEAHSAGFSAVKM